MEVALPQTVRARLNTAQELKLSIPGPEFTELASQPPVMRAFKRTRATARPQISPPIWLRALRSANRRVHGQLRLAQNPAPTEMNSASRPGWAPIGQPAVLPFSGRNQKQRHSSVFLPMMPLALTPQPTLSPPLLVENYL